MSRATARDDGRGDGRLASPIFALTSLLLAVTTAVVLLDLAAAFRPQVVPANPAFPESVALAARFYAAVDEVLRTGNTAPLTATTAPDLVEHPARAGGPPGLAGLLRSLRASRATMPQLRITVVSAEASAGGDEVTVRLRVTGARDGSFIGLALPTELREGGWGSVEVVRIADGLIAERWSGQAASELLEPLAAATLPLAGQAAPSAIALLRLTFGPYADLTVINGFPTRLVLVESGSVQIATLPTENGALPASVSLPVPESSPLPAPPPLTLNPGMQFLTEPGTNVRIANDAGSPATLLMAVRYGSAEEHAGARIEADVARLTRPEPAGVAVEILAVASDYVAGETTLGLGRATLTPGATLTWQAPVGSVLLAIEVGSLAVTTSTGEGPGAIVPQELTAGGSSFYSGAASWQATGTEQASLFVLTLIDISASPEPAS